jgi:hypothetical protein
VTARGGAGPVGGKRYVCATHGHCFDGLASAVVLRRLVEIDYQDHVFEVHACGYGHKQEKPTPLLLSGDGNAIVDFRYEPVDSLTHYFDHHRTAFADAGALQHFEQRAQRDPSRYVFDPARSSCTKLLADVAVRLHGADLAGLGSLITWADRIDSASFGSAEEATDKDEPVLRLAAVIEQFGDTQFLSRAAEVLYEQDLETLCRKRFVTDAYKIIGPRQDAFIARVRERGIQIGRVAFADLADQTVSAVTKFVQYKLWPTATYSVMVTSMASGVRIAIGHNPWSQRDLDVDISRICARYGGGGHPMVGGIGFSKDDLERARQVAQAIVEELQAPAPKDGES